MIIFKRMIGLCFFPTDETEVGKISKQKSKKNIKISGHDGITNQVSECCSSIIETYPAKKVNNCI